MNITSALGKTATGLAAVLCLCSFTARRPPPVLWAWERPEDMRFAGAGAEIAVLAGTVRLSGDRVVTKPRLQPVRVLPSQRLIGVVHVEIDHRELLSWSDAGRERVVSAVLALASRPPFSEIQVDFEVRASERGVLLDVLSGVRAGLPGRRLSMTALASWCDSETWIAAAPVDEVVPMLFRMGSQGDAIRSRFSSGRDFADPACRAAVGVSVDSARMDLPAGRRVFAFNPKPWTPEAFATLLEGLDP